MKYTIEEFLNKKGEILDAAAEGKKIVLTRHQMNIPGQPTTEYTLQIKKKDNNLKQDGKDKTV